MVVVMFLTAVPFNGLGIKTFAATQVEQIIAHAKYVAANNPHGYDGACLAFVGDCYKAAGYSHYSMGTAYNAGTAWIVSTSSTDIPVGALVFYDYSWHSTAGHVGIYAGNGQMYDAQSDYGGVKLRTFKTNGYRGWGWYGGVAPTGAGNYTSPPTDGWLWVEKDIAAIGEDIKLNFNATNATSFVIGIWKDNKEYAIIDNGYSDWHTISFNESGIYSIHVACYNSLGHCDSNYVNIFVYGNLGNDFNGVILNTKTWSPISVNENNYISLQQENRKANQVWNFTRQTDGSYIITSAYNGKVLEFYYGSAGINPVFANSSDGGYDYQRWYICSAFDGFCLLSKQDANKNLVLDLENKSSEYGSQVVVAQLNRSDSQIWSVYNQQDVQLEKPKLNVIENTSGKDTTFRWDDVYGENEYNLKIFKNGTEYKSTYLGDNSYDISLPSGNYTAFVRALNFFTYTESDTVSFVVKDTTLNIFFDPNGGSCLTDSKSVAYNSTYGYLPEPTKDNCIFVGWYTEKNGGEKVTSETIVNFVSDKIIYAHWILACEHEYISEITQQPTCTEKGIKAFTCSLCDDVYYEDVDELGHDYIGRVTEPTCTSQGFTTYECSRCDDSYTENYIEPLNHSSYSWHTAINPTATSEGLAEKRCDYCGMVLDQFIIPCLAPDYVTGITLSSEKETVEVGDTFTLSATVIPDTAKNKNVIWSSRNPEIVSVDNGKVTAIKPGTTAIVAETEDGGYIDFCLVRVISLVAFNGAVIDNDRNIIYGLSSNLESVDDYLITADDSMTVNLSTSTVGTGTFINVMDNGEVVDLYEAVVFGDVNGDSWYDGQDAVLVSCLANGMLTKEDVGEAVYTAADCNHDGIIDQLDVDLLNHAGALLANVDQSKSAEVLLETSSEYVEYLDLIDQSFEIEDEDETDIPEADAEKVPEADTDVEVEDTIPEQDASKEINFFEMIMNFIKSILEMLLTYITLPIK